VQVALAVLLVVVPLHGEAGLPEAVTVLVFGPSGPRKLQVQAAEAPGARVPIAAGLQRLPLTTTLLMVTVPQFVTVPEKMIGAPQGEGGVQTSLIARQATSQVQVELAVEEFTVPAHTPEAVPWAVTTFVTSPPVAQATVQLHATD
jgi:hypothetical protein